MLVIKKSLFSTFLTLYLCITVAHVSLAKPTHNPMNELFYEHNLKNYQPNFYSAWKTSPNGIEKATIEGRGVHATEEGQGVLVIQNKKNHISKIYTMNQKNGDLKDTPKYVEWIDNDRLFVIIGYAYGTVSKGGKLYELNISTNTITPIINHLKKNEEIISVHKDKNGGYIYEEYIYSNSKYTKGYFVSGTIPVTAIK